MKGRKNKAAAEKTTGPPDEKPKEQPKYIDLTRFVAQWNASATLREVAEFCGAAASTCAIYADRLRKDGYDLKIFNRGRPRRLRM